ncbi:F0F1 ATP synthase subunit gamma [Candidatus Sneabacter namystus]|uniref:F0F1 ATP synthase subunit gamma n=1 Tax=Candidatus Sneabacter namystus TaxID=2601646 RepID=A0A5C0UHC4_9RICK|nr:FoF1 ATP synthase subunit gamma [Candidatus Sneabacter namystus]QEK39508.1 F0F1 ATP synthase subunit gamma [Candidatus Sneabacter namystus]
MSKLKQITARIKSITEIRNITDTVRMIASIELERFKNQILLSKEFFNNAKKIAYRLEEKILQANHKQHKKNTNLAIVIGSDKGLCGGFNIKTLHNLKQLNKSVENLRCISVGSKIYSKTQNIGSFLSPNDPEQVLQVATSLTNTILDLVSENNVTCYLLYNDFKNFSTSVAQVQTIFPFTFEERIKSDIKKLPQLDDNVFIDRISNIYLQSLLHYSLISSKTSEVAARMIAMDSAYKNSKDMIKEMTLNSNKIRQKQVTLELIEIISGAMHT